MKLVHFDAPKDAVRAGKLVQVSVTRTGAWSLQGELALAPTAD